VGKTHLAAGICRSLIGLDRSARFFTATTLVQELQRAKAEFALALNVPPRRGSFCLKTTRLLGPRSSCLRDAAR